MLSALEITTLVKFTLLLACVAFGVSCIVDIVAWISKRTGEEGELEEAYDELSKLREVNQELEAELRFGSKINRYIIAELDQQKDKNDGLVASFAVAENEVRERRVQAQRYKETLDKAKGILVTQGLESGVAMRAMMAENQELRQQLAATQAGNETASPDTPCDNGSSATRGRRTSVKK